MDIDRLISERARSVSASGIRRVFELGARLKDPINLSIGQPDFAVPAQIKRAAIDAINADHNGYTLTQGVPALRARAARHIASDLGWPADSGEAAASVGVIITSGTLGALHTATLALVSPGDEIIIPDPYFVAYPHVITLAGGVAVRCDTYPDFAMTAQRVEPLISPRTKAIMLNSPGNPSGAVMTEAQCADLLDLCRRRGVLLISDEIYDEFCFPDSREVTAHNGPGAPRCPSPGRITGAHEDCLVIRGFGKTWGCTGWRLGYAAGPRRLIEEMAKLQQYTYTCAPTPLQFGCIPTFDVSMEAEVRRYEKRRDRVLSALAPFTTITRPGGAFYCFAEVPRRLGMTASEFCAKAVDRNVLLIPGCVFSDRDTHFRLSTTAPDHRLDEGLAILADMMRA